MASHVKEHEGEAIQVHKVGQELLNIKLPEDK